MQRKEVWGVLTPKEEIIHHYKRSIEWIRKLESLSEEQWRAPIEINKWTVAEVVGHLIPWDEFVLVKRIPYFLKEAEMPKSPNVNEVNNQASLESRMQMKAETIGKLLQVKQKLIDEIKDINEEFWLKEILIGTNSISLYSYFSGLLEHEKHHFKQIRKAVQIDDLID